MTTPDWAENQERLFQASVEALRRFAATHDTACSHFAFDADPLYGYVLCAFDTLEHSLQAAKQGEEYSIRQRKETFSAEDGWKYATHALRHPSVSPFCDNTGDFAFQHFVEVKFPEWQRYWEATGDSEVQEAGCNDYLGGHVRVLLWQVAERLVEAKAFDVLKTTTPFLVSYGIHDEEQQVLRVLRWPQDT